MRGIEPTVLAARVGMVWQDPASQLVMERVEDDVAFGLENRGWSQAAMEARVPEALAAVGLAGFERRRSRRLSGGQQQRLALAGALAPGPSVLVLDEPTANLDSDGATSFMERRARLRAERSTTIVLIEHLVEDAWPLADAILALDRAGRPIDVGAPAVVGARSGGRMRDAGIWLPADVERGLPGPSAADGRTARAEVARGRRPERAPIEPPVVSASALRYAFDAGVPAVDGIDLAISPGERVALVGPNGSGKSTLGRLLVGLLRPGSGSVGLQGTDPARLPPADLARRASYVFQDPERQFLARTVETEILLGLRADEAPRAADLMARLGLPLETYGERSPYRLSGGEKRRLSLACALVRAPAVLVLDEPTFGQDRHGYDALLAILSEHLAAGAALIAATHDARFVADATDRTVTLAAGRVVGDDRRGAADR